MQYQFQCTHVEDIGKSKKKINTFVDNSPNENKN